MSTEEEVFVTVHKVLAKYRKHHSCDLGLTEHGIAVEPTLGDVRAIWRACERLLSGEILRSETRQTEEHPARPLEIRANTVRVAGEIVFRGSAYDCAVTAYGLISSFNASWDLFDDGKGSFPEDAPQGAGDDGHA